MSHSLLVFVFRYWPMSRHYAENWRAFQSAHSLKEMSKMSVRSLLLVNSSGDNHSLSILFHCARYWAEQGRRVLFISETPLLHLPLRVGKINPSFKPDVFKMIQFMYLSDWKELLKQLYSMHIRCKPVSVIIIKNLENYFRNDVQIHSHEDHVSLICASLLFAVTASAKVVSEPVFLVSDYFSKDSSIEKIVVKNFFHNVWEIKSFKKEEDEDERTFIKLSRLSVPVNDEIAEYTFYENTEESLLHFDKIIKNIINKC